jgi:hypothetical protein
MQRTGTCADLTLLLLLLALLLCCEPLMVQHCMYWCLQRIGHVAVAAQLLYSIRVGCLLQLQRPFQVPSDGSS